MSLPRIGSKIVLEGQREYKDALSSVNKVTQLLGSEMRNLSKEFDGNANSIEALDSKNTLLKKQYEEQKKRIELLNGALEDSIKVYGENSTQTMDWQTKINKAYDALWKFDEEIKANEKYMKEASESTDGTAKSIDEFGKKTKFGRGLVDEFGNRIDKNGDLINEFGNEIVDAEKKVSIFGDVLKANLASELIIAGTKKLAESIKELGKFSTGVGIEFSSSMSSVAATMGITSEEIKKGNGVFKDLSDAAKDMGENTEFSASQASNALESLALAGYDAEKSISTLPGVLNLATAGGLELQQSATLLTDSMAALGLETEQLDEHMDKMAKTAQSSNTNVAQLGEGILASAGMANSAGQELTTLNTALGILANNGLKGAEGGTKLRNVLQSLTAPTDKARTELDRLGISAADGQGNFKQLDEILLDLNTELSTMSQADKAQIITKIFNKTDITAVNALLKSTSGEFDDLKDKINNAEGAASDMAKTMRDNLAGDLKGLESVTEAIGITFFEKFEKPLRNATQTATKGLADLNGELKNGEIGASADKLADSFAEASEKVIDFGINSLPKVIDGLSWILDNSNLIIGGVSGVGSAMLTFKVGGAIQSGLTAINTAWTVFKAKTEGATIAQFALNTAMNANPVILLATGVGVLVGAMVTYNSTIGKSKKETDEFSDGMARAKKTADNMIKTLEDSEKNWKKSNVEMEKNALIASKLSDELYKLSEQEDLSNKEKLKMKSLVENLNEMVPDLNLVLDEQTGILNRQKGEVDKLVTSYMDMAKAEAAAESLKEMLKEQLEAEVALQELLKNRPKWYEALDGTGNGLMKSTTEKWADSIKELHKSMEDLEERIEITTEIAGESFGEVSDATSEMADKSIENLDKTVQANEEATNAMIEAQEEYQKTLEKTSDSIYNSTSLFDEFAWGTEVSGEKLLNNLQEQVSGMREWSANLSELSRRGIREGLLQELYDMGPKAYAEIKALTKMTDTELNAYSRAWEDKTKTASDIAIKQLELQKQGMSKVAEDISRDMQMQGKNAGRAYSEGIANNEQSMQGSFNRVRNSATNYSKNLLNDAGKETARGFIKGWSSQEEEIKKTVSKTMNSVTGAVKDTLQIKSPSRIFEQLGKFTGEGFEIGFNKSMLGIGKEIQIPNINKKFEASTRETIGYDTPRTLRESINTQSAAGDSFIVNVNVKMEEVDEVYKLVNVFENFKQISRGGFVLDG